MKSSATDYLLSMGVKMTPPTSQFVDWLTEKKLNWIIKDGFLEMLPSAHCELKVCGRLWCYLWSESRIKANAEEYNSFRHLGIGSLGSGDWLAIDLQIHEQPMLGSVGIRSLLAVEASREPKGFSDLDFRPFDLSFGKWLELIVENPYREDVPS